MKKNRLLMVDAFSGGKLYSEIAIKDFNFEVFHLMSSETLPEYYTRTFNPKSFTDTFVWTTANGPEIIANLRNLKFSAVIAGTETGVELADYLAEELGLIGNGSEKSRFRRSKTLMHQLVQKHGVRIPIQTFSNTFEEASHFIDTNLKYPVIVKPDESAGSDGFNLVKNSTELKNIFDNLVSSKNRLGLINHGLIVQELIEGPEYAINTVSSEGKHFITHIWQYHKINQGNSKIYDWEEYILPDSQLGKEIYKFVIETLNALGIRYGAAHTELMVDSKGPVLIESASRVDGICNPNIDDIAIGLNQIYLSLLSFITPESVESYINSHFKVTEHIANVSLISNQVSTSEIYEFNDQPLKTIESFRDIRWFLAKGDHLKATVDIFSAPGFIYLQNKNRENLMKDYKKIRELDLNEIILTK